MDKPKEINDLLNSLPLSASKQQQQSEKASDSKSITTCTLDTEESRQKMRTALAETQQQEEVKLKVQAFHQATMDRLWLRMTEIYGHKWASQYGTTPNQMWTDALKGITRESIKRGFGRLITETNHDEWPPNAIEFYKLCAKKSVSPTGINHKAYLSLHDKNHPDYRPRRLAITDQKVVEKRNKKAKEFFDELRKGI